MKFDRETIEELALDLIKAAAEVGAPIALGALSSAEGQMCRARAVQAIQRGIAWVGHWFSGETEKAEQEKAYMTLAVGQMLALLGVAEANMATTTKSVIARFVGGMVEKRLGI